MSNQRFDFNNLFIFEMANNHQGDVEHGLHIVREMGNIAREAGVRGAVKLQFRDIDTFIHPLHKKKSDNKHVPRFIDTRLTKKQFKKIVDEIKHEGLVSIVTPFDEPSVDMIEDLDVEIIKIGSCSATDWPLLERVVESNKPIVCSTGGLRIQEIDKIVSFFQHRGVHFAIMHCVALYPTPKNKLQLNQIEFLRRRYPCIPIGFSTHEDPNDVDAIKIAYTKGARIFEKHVAIPTKEYKINAYSATPEQVREWIFAWNSAVAMCGAENRPPTDYTESDSLRALGRGVYAKKSIRKGARLSRNMIYFAFPPSDGQILSGEWKENMISDRTYKIDEPISEMINKSRAPSEKEIIAYVVHELKGMLNSANIQIGASPEVELSHHYGLPRFREYGAALVNCINREYCKKIIIQLPGQRHPYHFHKKKEEAFQVLDGELIMEIEGREKILYPGDVLVVPRAAWHSFYTNTGAIFEEVSTTHYNDDSFYEDKQINKLPREARKTRLHNWGRHQFDDV